MGKPSRKEYALGTLTCPIHPKEWLHHGAPLVGAKTPFVIESWYKGKAPDGPCEGEASGYAPSAWGPVQKQRVAGVRPAAAARAGRMAAACAWSRGWRASSLEGVASNQGCQRTLKFGVILQQGRRVPWRRLPRRGARFPRGREARRGPPAGCRRPARRV